MSNSEQHNSDTAPDDNLGLRWDISDGPSDWDADDPVASKQDYEFNDEVRKVYSNGMYVAALRSEKVPAAAAHLGTLSYAVKLCILHGIRHHHGFGMELHNPGPDYSCFRRTLNARAVMSDEVPDMDIVNDASSVPYCIWYPDVASEDTYRELSRRYPQTRYQVGRACAVAGYSDLYKELGLLPDITIAEEAQDNFIRSQRKDGCEGNRGNAEIFQHIIQQPEQNDQLARQCWSICGIPYLSIYYGDIDRYARLRRPHHVSLAEPNCIAHGIYHNTAFERWCSIHLPDARSYQNVITARFIMSNDLSRITDDIEDDKRSRGVPWQIWYPQRAAAATYRELVARKPIAMMAPVARAVVIADYQDLWDELVDRIELYWELVEEAQASPNPHYINSLRESCTRRGIDLDKVPNKYPESVGGPFCALDIESSATVLPVAPMVDHISGWDAPVHTSWHCHIETGEWTPIVSGMKFISLITICSKRVIRGSLSKCDRLSYISAAYCLASKNSTTPLSQAPGPVSRYHDFVWCHIEQTPFVHSDVLFLGFHRQFAHLYEEALRSACGYEGAQPYWDSSVSYADPRKSTVFDGSPWSMGSNGVYIPNRPNTTIPPPSGGALVFPPATSGGCVHSGPFTADKFQIHFGPIGTDPKGPQDGLDLHPSCLTLDLSLVYSNNCRPTIVLALIAESEDLAAFSKEVDTSPLGIHGAGHFDHGPSGYGCVQQP
ncbi:hypothetical protein GE09DRAFT_1270042 [Coniochaeta sp. 2T2.1]|nr:hypothetical protein GE09DRAFT_1270042 [Coniochaeta sp. 2T2.1]